MAIALDGSVTGQFTASASGAVALATLVNADEIIVAVSIAGASSSRQARATRDAWAGQAYYSSRAPKGTA